MRQHRAIVVEQTHVDAEERPALLALAPANRAAASRCSCFGSSTPVVPSGLISVMPQAWMTRAPCSRSQASIIGGGQAEPPITTFSTVVSRLPWARRCASSAIHTVGTPSRLVTCSPSMSSSRLTGSSPGPGRTSFDPFIAAAYGTPHALTWNIGTTGRMTSCAETPSASVIEMPNEWMTVVRCE